MSFIKYFENKSFWDSTQVVQQESIITEIKQMLDKHNIEIKSEIILSAYLIHLYPDDILSTNRNIMENFIKEKSDCIVDIIESNKLKDKKNIVVDYEKHFTDWKTKDVDSQIKIYLELYISYKNMRNIDCEEKDKVVDDLYKAIKFLSKNNQDTLIEEFEGNYIRDAAVNLHFQVNKQMRNAYWDNVKKQGINNDLIIEWLKDVKDLFLDIYRQYRYSSQKIENLNEYIDIDFIKPQIHTFDIDKLLHWILNETKDLDAASFDSEYEEMHKSINKKDYIVCVKYIFERLEDIKNFSVNTN